MKQLKRLQALEERLNQISQVKDLEEEYLLWLAAHPIGGLDDIAFDFYQWLDSMPPHLIRCFQRQLKQVFPFLDLPPA